MSGRADGGQEFKKQGTQAGNTIFIALFSSGN